MFDFANIKEVRLSRGAHKSPEQGMCFMEMAAWFAGEEHSDKPACVSPSLGALGIAINDGMRDAERDRALKPIIAHVVGTADDEAEGARIEYICVRAFNYAAGLIVPEFARHNGLARTFHDVLRLTGRIHEHMRYGDYYSMKYGTSDHVATAMEYAMMKHGNPGLSRDLFQRIYAISERRISFSLKPSIEPVAIEDATIPNIENARAAAAVFALIGEHLIPDWSAAVDTLREAIKLGRHDGFDVAVNLEKRHEALRELIDA